MADGAKDLCTWLHKVLSLLQQLHALAWSNMPVQLHQLLKQLAAHTASAASRHITSHDSSVPAVKLVKTGSDDCSSYQNSWLHTQHQL
jgi:hypothetical protein